MQRVIFDVYCPSEDMADFHILQGKLEPPTLKTVVHTLLVVKGIFSKDLEPVV